MSTETALTVAERAAIAIGAPAYEIALVDLVKESASLVQIKDKSGYQQAHSARMRLKGTRVEIQKRAKDAREDAQAFSKAVIAEEKRLVALVCPEEDRLQGLQDVWDAAREAEKQARIQAEQQRVERHRAKIDAIRATALHAARMGSDGIQVFIDDLENVDLSGMEEFATGARVVRDETLSALRTLHASALEREAEVARLKAEREELARLRAEQERIAAEERAKVEAAQQAERDRLAAERAERERVEAAERARVAEAQRIEAERLAEERRQFAAERAELKRQQDAIAAEQRRQHEEAEAKERAVREAEEQRKREAEAEQRRLADASVQRTKRLREAIDAHLDRCTDEELGEVLQFVTDLHQKAVA